jgi:hypothetical protein
MFVIVASSLRFGHRSDCAAAEHVVTRLLLYENGNISLKAYEASAASPRTCVRFRRLLFRFVEGNTSVTAFVNRDAAPAD